MANPRLGFIGMGGMGSRMAAASQFRIGIVSDRIKSAEVLREALRRAGS